jgi:hypothetical protein
LWPPGDVMSRMDQLQISCGSSLKSRHLQSVKSLELAGLIRRDALAPWLR